MNQLARSPQDRAVLEHATNFLRIADPEKTEQVLLGAARSVDAAAVWLGDLYALAALGVTGLDLKTGLPAAAGEKLPVGFAAVARSALSSTPDARIVLSALASFTAGGRALAKLNCLPEGYADWCGQLLLRARVDLPADLGLVRSFRRSRRPDGR